MSKSDVLRIGLAPCRCCGRPVAAPLGILDRELFHISRCYNCRAIGPHPQEKRELDGIRRTAVLGTLALIVGIGVARFAPLAMLLQHLT